MTEVRVTKVEKVVLTGPGMCGGCIKVTVEVTNPDLDNVHLAQRWADEMIDWVKGKWGFGIDVLEGGR